MTGETEVQAPAEVTEDIKATEASKAKEAEAAGEEKKDAEKVKSPKKKEKVPPPPAVHKKNFEKDVVYLYQFRRSTKLPNLSAYCLKLETWLKLNGVKYENVDHQEKKRSKRGLLPFVELNGEEIADSEIIMEKLGETFGSKAMMSDSELDQEQKGVSHAMSALLENHLRICIVSWLSRNPANTIKAMGVNLQQQMGSKLPNGLLLFIMKQTFFKNCAKVVKGAGFNGYTNEEIDEMGKKDLKVLSELVGDKKYFFGDRPSMLDLRAFAWLSQLVYLDKEVPCAMRDYLEEECTNLLNSFNNMKELAWGEHWDLAIGEKQELNPHIPKPDPPKEEEKKEEEKKDEDKKEEATEEKKDEEAEKKE